MLCATLPVTFISVSSNSPSVVSREQVADQPLDCKTTAALIGQQSFGGSRASGTNDKAGSSNPMFRFTSPRLIKEEFFPAFEYRYPSNN